jgi:hypothetical protein
MARLLACELLPSEKEAVAGLKKSDEKTGF